MKKQSRLRLFIQCLSFAFHNGYMNGWIKGKIYSGGNKAFCLPGLNCYSCPGALGACPIGSLQAVLDDSGFHISLYVIGFIGMVGVFCGRFVCGWICPFGLVQDLLYRIPFVKKVKNLPGHKYLKYLRFVILAVFVILLPMGAKNQSGQGQPWFCAYICPSGTLLGGIPLVLANENLQAIIGPRFFWKLFLLAAILLAAVYSDRPFCKYVCPLGALYGLANPVSLYRLKVNKETCTGCGACQRACGADIRVWETPNSMDCIRCGKCMKACPTGSITSTFGSCFGKVMPEQQKSTEVQAEETKQALKNRKQKSFRTITSAVLCAGTAICASVPALLILFRVIITYPRENTADYISETLGYVTLLIPAAMSVFTGIRLLKAYKRKEAVSKELCSWPLRTAAVSLFCVAFACLAVFVSLPVYYRGWDSYLVSASFWGCSAGMQLMLILAAVNLFSWFLLREHKSSKEKTSANAVSSAAVTAEESVPEEIGEGITTVSVSKGNGEETVPVKEIPEQEDGGDEQ